MQHHDLATLVASVRAHTLRDPWARAAAAALESAIQSLRPLDLTVSASLDGCQIGSPDHIGVSGDPASSHAGMRIERIRADLRDAIAAATGDRPCPLGRDGLHEITVALDAPKRGAYRYVLYDGMRFDITKPRFARALAAGIALTRAGVSRPTIPYAPPSAPHPCFFVSYSRKNKSYVAPENAPDQETALRLALWEPVMGHLLADAPPPVLGANLTSQGAVRDAIASLAGSDDPTDRLIALFAGATPEAA